MAGLRRLLDRILRRPPQGRRRAPVPTILQMEAVECGAASLAMILAHHGAWRPLEEIRIATGVTRDGTKASNLLKAARSYGLTAKGYRKEPEGLADLPWPLILHWNFNHFLVLEGMDEAQVHLNDPAIGARRVSHGELHAAFTGVALAFEKTADFVTTPPPPGLLTALRQRIAGSESAALLIALVSVLLIVPGFVLPVFAKLFVDGIVVRQQEHWVVPLFVAFAATAACRAALTLVRASLMLRLEAKLTIVGASRFVHHILRLPMAFFTQRNAGEIAGRIDIGRRVARVVSSDLANAVIDWGTVFAFGLCLVAYDLELGGVAVMLALPSVLLLRRVQRQRVDDARITSNERGKLAAITVGAVADIETIKASGLESSSFGRWAGQHTKLVDALQTVGRRSIIVLMGPPLMAGLIRVAVLGVGATKVMSGTLTIGDLVAFQSLAESFVAPLSSIVALDSTLNGVRADIARVEDALSFPSEQRPVPVADRPVVGAAGGLVLDRVAFGYNPLDEPLLGGISLAVGVGERVALVGRSGCGKSTLGRLICGLAHPREGRILVDGVPLAEMAAEERARRIAFVDQDIFLFEGTVRENLALWNPDVPDEILTRALEDAAMLDDVVARPGELDAVVEEGGRNFSGGQRQRLEIARALVGDPSILVLDEATAALDPQTEALIDLNLRRRGCTCIIIAHRLSTIRDCTEIIMLDRGRIVERGTHDVLMALDGGYAAMIRSS